MDKLYKPVTGTTAGAGAPPAGGAPPPEGGAPPPPSGGEPPIPENVNRKDKNKLILESLNEDSFDEEEFLDFQKVNNTLGDLDDQLSKLLGD